jgi:hypothetical protein
VRLCRYSENTVLPVEQNQFTHSLVVARTIHLFIESVACLYSQKKSIDVYWAVYLKGRQLSRTANVLLSLGG